MLNSILTTIVLYKQKLEDSNTFQTLSALNGFDKVTVVVYDNSPASNYNYSGSLFNISYIHDPSNSGISKAYNTSAQIALRQHKKWLLLLDQDSYLPPDFLEILVKNIVENPDEVIFAPILKQNGVILSPCKFTYMKGSAFNSVKPGKLLLKNVSILNSAMCVNLAKFIEVGGYNENIKLDFSDHAFISRIKKSYHSITVTGTVVAHQLSSNSANKQIVFNRFKQYCEGIRAYRLTEQKSSLLVFWTALRALKLFFVHKDCNYLKTFIYVFTSKPAHS
jgi:rhamnosyltransferase